VAVSATVRAATIKAETGAQHQRHFTVVADHARARGLHLYFR
jgi:hypothetical protein